jgi:hypothetical protein
MMPVFPFSEAYRASIASELYRRAGALDPGRFLRQEIFAKNARHAENIPMPNGMTPRQFYQSVVRYCEVSAWAEEPPLIISLLTPFEIIPAYHTMIDMIRKEGPFRCHPTSQPYYVCRVAAELPLLGRQQTRAAALAFDIIYQRDGRAGRRVLRVFGPPESGKTYTLRFFQYLAAMQPLHMGVLDIDFGNTEMITQAASADIPIELYLAQQLEEQVRQRRAELRATPAVAVDLNGLPDLLPLIDDVADQRYIFQPLTDLQQRNRWAKDLAGELVDQVLSKRQAEPDYWVIVFDNCEQAPAEAQEFVRRLVERAAGTDASNFKQADEGRLRVVLLGDSATILPNPVYRDHILDEDLAGQSLGENEAQLYFQVFCLSRSIRLDNDPQKVKERLQLLAKESVERAKVIAASDGKPVPWPRALATAVLEKTLPLEAQAAQKRGDL